MKILLIVMVAVLQSANFCYSQNESNIEELRREIQQVSDLQTKISEDIAKLKKENRIQNKQIKDLSTTENKLLLTLDSLNLNVNELTTIQNKDRVYLQDGILKTNTIISTNLDKLDSRTLWGGLLLLLTIIGFSVLLYLKWRKDYSSMNEVRKAQYALQNAQKKMQEDSIKLDNQIITLMEKQMSIVPMSSKVLSNTDHSLVLKVADEIVRIELNLSRMDASMKGYKQLSKAVERIKNNFLANGYEIIDMLGKPYNEGMKVVANFVPDDTLKEGEQIITSIIKPQINYNGQMIQSAQITVSQNI